MKPIKMQDIAIVVICALIFGYIAGRTDTIRQAELISVDDCEYHISFGDEIHVYTFD